MRWATLLAACLSSAAAAHQPVMDMAPRWDNGYGAQLRYEHFNSTSTTWLEGVYTWDRSIRATFKLPYANGELGDLILGMPLKKYRNAGAHTSNWSLTPSVKVPTGGGGRWQPGLSLSYSAETPGFYQLYDLYALGDRIGLDVNAGLAFRRDGGGLFALWDLSVLSSDDGDRVQSGPVVIYFKDNVMFRAEYKALIYERDSNWSGGFFNIGFGVVY